MEQYQQNYSPIINFYENKSIFITGGSGFMGKVLIEKLLRSCMGIDKIYILLRHKRNRQPNERLHDLINAPLFDMIREVKPEQLNKIILVEGDVTLDKLGMSEQDYDKVSQDVSVVFHSAATIKFDEPLKQSVSINVTGTKNIIELCRKMPKLSALVHVSTAYANCDKPIVDERVYATEESPDKLIDMAKWMDEDVMQALKAKLLRLRPNTYTYTKALAETLLAEQASDLPVVICRPSIVVASWREPFRGWIDNINGPTGILLAVGKGLVRSMMADKRLKSDIIPVDTVINLMITLGWYVAKKHQHSGIVKAKLSSDFIEASLQEELMTGYDMPKENLLDHLKHRQEDNNIPNELNNNDQKFENNNSNSNNNNDINIENNNCTNITNLMNNYNSSASIQKECQQGVRLDDGYSSAPTTPDLNVEIGGKMKSVNNSKGSDSCVLSGCCKNLKNTIATNNNNNDVVVINNNNSSRKTYNDSDSIISSERKLIPVFHCTSGALNPITWRMVQDFVLFWLRIYPSIQVFRYPDGDFQNRRYIDNFCRIILHYVPAYLLDMMTRLSGGKPILVRIFQKFDQAAQVLAAFTVRDWIFKSDNIQNLLTEMSSYDRVVFHCDITQLHWETYFMDYVLGIRKYLLKEPSTNLKQARKNLNRVYYRNLILQILFWAVFVYYAVLPSDISDYMSL